MIHFSKEGSLIKVKVTPRASFNQLVGWEGEYLKIRVKALPEKGDANATLLAFLSKELNVPKSRISLIKGHTSRIKQILFSGLSPQSLQEKLTPIIGNSFIESPRR